MSSRYPTQAVIRQHRQRGGRNYHKYRACLRLEFEHRCVYCRTSEAEVKPVRQHAGFEIDHFRPVALFEHLESKYSNLYWSCPDCNRVKAQKWPSPAEVKLGHRFVDVCAEPPSEHLDVIGEEVVAKTVAGQYTIDEIQLNSVMHRRRRADRLVMVQRLSMLARLAEDDAARAAAIAMLEELKAGPWDADPRCLCSDVAPLPSGP